MPAPQIEARGQGGGTVTTSHAIRKPSGGAGVQSGDLLVAVVGVDRGASIVDVYDYAVPGWTGGPLPPSGWTLRQTMQAGSLTVYVLTGVGTGSEGSSVFWVKTDISAAVVAHTLGVVGAPDPTAVQISAGATGTGADPDPDGVDHAPGAALYLALGFSDTTMPTTTSHGPPPGYGHLAGNVSNSFVSTATRQPALFAFERAATTTDAPTTEDPGPMTTGGPAADWIGVTLAIGVDVPAVTPTPDPPTPDPPTWADSPVAQPGTWEAFVTSPDRDEVVLVELEPRVQLAGFETGAGGAKVFNVPLAQYDGDPAVTGGLYRRVIGVLENETPLTEVADLVTLSGTRAAWWYDEAAERLYVHTSTDGDPDTFEAYQAVVRFHVATRPWVLDLVDHDPTTGYYYHPLIATRSALPTVSERDDEQAGGTKVSTTTTLELVNASGVWDTIIAHDSTYRWKNATVRFLVGGRYAHDTRVLLRSAFREIVTMRVEDLAAEEVGVEIVLKPRARDLAELVPKTPFFEDEYPNLGDGVRGTKKWLGYGRTIMRPDVTDPLTANNFAVYTVADAAFQTLTEVHAIWAVSEDDGTRTALDLADTDLVGVDLASCTVAVAAADARHVPSYPPEQFTIEVDVTGAARADGTAIETIGSVVEHLLTSWLRVPVADLDTAAFTQADLDAPEPITMWVKSPRAAHSLLETVQTGLPSLEPSVQANVGQTADGRWTIDVWDPTYDASTLPTLRKTQFRTFRPEPKLESVYSHIRVHYGYNHASGEWRVASADDLATAYRNLTHDVLEIYTFLRDEVDALVLAQRRLLTHGGLSLAVEFDEVGITLADARVRDRVLVDYDPAPVAAGKFDQTVFELARVDRRLAPTLGVGGRLINLRGVGGRIGRWTDDAAPSYLAATTTDRNRSGYWLDDNCEAEPGNPLTRNISIWW